MKQVSPAQGTRRGTIGGMADHPHEPETPPPHRHEHDAPGGSTLGAEPDERSDSERVWSFTRESARELDRLALEEFGLPGIVLMENAAIGLADEILERLDAMGGRRVAVCCGPGNNGGDGLAAARHLANAGAEVTVFIMDNAGREGTDAGVHRRVVERMGLPVVVVREGDEVTLRVGGGDSGDAPPDVILDAVLGTGLSRPPEGAALALIRAINAAGDKGAFVVSADLPSGLDADTGAPLDDDATVRAAVTVTFAGLKAGFASMDAQGFVGELVVVDIGVPIGLLERLGEPVPFEDGPEPTPGRTVENGAGRRRG